MKRFPRLFPLLLVLMLSVLTMLLDRVTRQSSVQSVIDRDQPEYTVENFTATRFDAQGLPSDRLQARKMWQFPDAKDIEFEQPFLTSYQLGQVNYTVEGEVGRYNNSTGMVWFDRKVVLIDKAEPGQSDIKIDTRAMTVNLNTSTAQSPAAVTVHQGDSVANAIGFTYAQQQGLITLLSKVRISYAQP
ncbi:LPS export ABC transporter periplasmic protein LptC [Craterilacuibacter sp. RT1T]|uniref:LPS export ABC transporter periplasmic protein LptC n=1 Tax=Craterilacuibacter sp. RT1T TaxID=2942211 RepID=UPI0020BDA1FD|nr:LPS export ABC transporter periplasmic protein LptC [Craterilacuibacter sp. RT1T]MCL6263874.1 LPS export ABC transporter periplasmic protein LptC [Craterilacuibacter sp. RT1T]